MIEFDERQRLVYFEYVSEWRASRFPPFILAPCIYRYPTAIVRPHAVRANCHLPARPYLVTMAECSSPNASACKAYDEDSADLEWLSWLVNEAGHCVPPPLSPNTQKFVTDNDVYAVIDELYQMVENKQLSDGLGQVNPPPRVPGRYIIMGRYSQRLTSSPAPAKPVAEDEPPSSPGAPREDPPREDPVAYREHIKAELNKLLERPFDERGILREGLPLDDVPNHVWTTPQDCFNAYEHALYSGFTAPPECVLLEDSSLTAIATSSAFTWQFMPNFHLDSSFNPTCMLGLALPRFVIRCCDNQHCKFYLLCYPAKSDECIGLKEIELKDVSVDRRHRQQFPGVLSCVITITQKYVPSDYAYLPIRFRVGVAQGELRLHKGQSPQSSAVAAALTPAISFTPRNPRNDGMFEATRVLAGHAFKKHRTRVLAGHAFKKQRTGSQ
jgi:hypothetical protein